LGLPAANPVRVACRRAAAACKSDSGDKLSPRWQYGVWGVLALRILLPASAAGRYILLPLPLWTETVKAVAERSLSSAYSAAYAPAVPRFPVPWVTGLPASVTDWLFIVYIAGAAAFALRYAVGYIRLRALLRRGRPAPEAVTERIARSARRMA
jgi:hypothetical protein